MKNLRIVLLFIIGLFLFACEDEKEEPVNPPVFSGAVSITFQVNEEDEIDFTTKVSLFDTEDGSLPVTNEMINTDDFDITVVGVYTVVYSYTDTDGNNTEYDLIVNVVDTIGPLVSLVGDRLVIVLEGEEYTDEGVVTSDNYDSSCDLTIGGDIVVVNTVGVYTITYQCEDDYGNLSNLATRIVEVVERLTYDYQIGDEVQFTGYFKEDNTDDTLRLTSGIFFVRAVDHLAEYPIGISTEMGGEVELWVKDENITTLDNLDTLPNLELEVGLLHQFDYSGYLNGSTMTISGYGCALTAITMVINYHNDTNLTPVDTNPDIVQSGLVYWVNANTSTYENLKVTYFPSYDLYRTAKQFSNQDDYNLLKERIKEKLEEGYPVIVNISGNTTHYVVAYGYYYNEDGILSIKINDPGSSYRFELEDVTGSYPTFFEGFIYFEK